MTLSDANAPQFELVDEPEAPVRRNERSDETDRETADDETDSDGGR